MTGVGAIFELYTAYKESKKDVNEDKEEPKLEPDPEESVEGYIDEESEWHYVIENQAWDALLEMLQGYDFQKYKPKEPDKKKKKRLRVVGAAMWVKNKVVTQKPPEEQPPSPLLALNEREQTPLHLAVKNLAPDKYVIRMVFCEKRAALISDEEGKLPLHWSCICERNTPVIDRLIRANFHHMQRIDNDGKTAVCYAFLKATEKKDLEGNPELYWGIPRTKGEQEWQERQEQTWSKARFVLLCYSTRKKVFIEAERELLLQALEYAAPPGLIEVCILGGQGMLHTDPTLASSALRWFLRRQYPIKNLQLLLHHFPDEDVESLEVARKLLTEYYHEGCRRVPSRKCTFREEMEKHALEENYRRTLACQEWWNKIQCLLRLCGHQNSKDKKKLFENKYLLHAALTNSDTPPSLVQLLMVMTPEAIRLQHPFNQSMLVHLICRNWKYNLYPHSKKIGVQIDLEEPPMEQVLKIVLASDPTLPRKRHRDRLPLHHALASCKSVEFLDVLVQKDRKSLSVRDPQTKLYPFQMAALGSLNKNAAVWAYARRGPDEWKNLEPEDRAKAVDEVIEEQQVEQLNTIYYLLRQFPAAAERSASLHRAHGFRDAYGKGMVSAHYLLLMYARGENDDYLLLKNNLALVHEAINTGKIPEDLEQWWSKLKFWIRYCYVGKQSLPSSEEYLLHAAVSNSDVPPLLIQLVLAIYPTSVSLPVHGDNEYPLHIAAATPQYEPQPFEMIEVKSVIELLFDGHPEASKVQSPSGSPLEIAQACELRSDDEIRLLGGKPTDFTMNMAEEEEEIDVSIDDVGEEMAEERAVVEALMDDTVENSSIQNSEMFSPGGTNVDEPVPAPAPAPVRLPGTTGQEGVTDSTHEPIRHDRETIETVKESPEKTSAHSVRPDAAKKLIDAGGHVSVKDRLALLQLEEENEAPSVQAPTPAAPISIPAGRGRQGLDAGPTHESTIKHKKTKTASGTAPPSAAPSTPESSGAGKTKKLIDTGERVSVRNRLAMFQPEAENKQAPAPTPSPKPAVKDKQAQAYNSYHEATTKDKNNKAATKNMVNERSVSVKDRMAMFQPKEEKPEPPALQKKKRPSNREIRSDKSEKEKLKRAAVKLQSFVRGSIARARVSEMVDDLIEQMEDDLEEPQE